MNARPDGEGGRVLGPFAAGLALLGAVLLAVSTVVELSDIAARAQLWVGAAAGACFLVAAAFSRGADARVLVVRARLLVAAGLGALLSVVGLWQVTERAAPSVLLLLAPVSLLFVTAGLALREAAASGRQARRRELRSRLQGEESERRRWVRELHDGTLQNLAAVNVALGTATAGPDTPSVEARIAGAREMISHEIQSLRRLIVQMRPLSLDLLGLAAALEELARRTAGSSGTPVATGIADLPRLPADVEASAYRVAQEALANAVRHSGAAHIRLTATAAAGWLELSVRDDGRGLATAGAGPGYGLLGMRERAEALGGTLAVVTPPEGGTLVRLHVPLGG